MILAILWAACRDDEAPHIRRELEPPEQDDETSLIMVQVQQMVHADLLIVLDVSPSMEPYWARASAGIEDLLAVLYDHGYHLHIGLVTTDMGSADGGGRLVELGGQRYLDGSEGEDNAVDWLELALASVSPHVQGEEGVRAAIAAALTQHQGAENAGFFREGVDLDLLVFTDAEDLSKPDPDDLSGLLDSRGTTHVHGVLSPQALSTRQLIAETGGLHYSIGAGDYESFFGMVGRFVEERGLIDQIQLPSRAQPDSVSVFVSGDVWEGEHLLVSDGDVVLLLDPKPPAGVTITVEYLELR